jgi:hypothetical protein
MKYWSAVFTPDGSLLGEPTLEDTSLADSGLAARLRRGLPPHLTAVIPLECSLELRLAGTGGDSPGSALASVSVAHDSPWVRKRRRKKGGQLPVVTLALLGGEPSADAKVVRVVVEDILGSFAEVSGMTLSGDFAAFARRPAMLSVVLGTTATLVPARLDRLMMGVSMASAALAAAWLTRGEDGGEGEGS